MWLIGKGRYYCWLVWLVIKVICYWNMDKIFKQQIIMVIWFFILLYIELDLMIFLLLIFGFNFWNF